MAHDDPKDDDWPDLPESLKRKPQDKPAVGWHFPTEGAGTPHPKPAPRKTKLAPKSKAVAPAGKLPVPRPKSQEAVKKFTDPAVGNPPGEADVRRTGKRPGHPLPLPQRPTTTRLP